MSETNDQVDEVEATEPDPISPAKERDDAEAKAADAKSDGQLVAERSADVSAEESDEHVKVFVIEPGPKPTEANGYEHGANMAAVRSYMISQGLRPTGDVHLVSIKPHELGGVRDKKYGWDVTYAVPAVPAERFDFTEVHVVTDNETGANGVANATQTGANSPDSAIKTDEVPVPTAKSKREDIDAYAKSKGIDTTGAANKAEALALLSKPTA